MIACKSMCIMFVRKKEDIDAPYITLELDFKQNVIKQARYKYNKAVEDKTLNEIKKGLVNKFVTANA